MNNKKAGEFIKDLRIELGISQEDLAKKVSITREAVSKWENGNNMPTYDSALLLSKIFNVSVEELLLGERKNSKTTKAEAIRSIYHDK